MPIFAGMTPRRCPRNAPTYLLFQMSGLQNERCVTIWNAKGDRWHLLRLHVQTRNVHACIVLNATCGRYDQSKSNFNAARQEGGCSMLFYISRPKLKIWRKIWREVLDWSAYHAAAGPRLRLNISVAIDPRLSKLKIWNLWKKVFLFLYYLIFR